MVASAASTVAYAAHTRAASTILSVATGDHPATNWSCTDAPFAEVDSTELPAICALIAASESPSRNTLRSAAVAPPTLKR